MITLPTKIYKDLSESDARDILEVDAKIGFPPVSGGTLKCTMEIDCSYVQPNVSIYIYDDDANTEWEVNVNSKRMYHRGYGEGCIWVEFGSSEEEDED